MLEVAEHYDHFGGVSPINAQVRDLIAALRPELRPHGISLPIYWGNRNWHPMLADTLPQMARRRRQAGAGDRPGGVQLLFELPPVSRGHRAARGPQSGRDAPEVDKVRVFYNHPDFIAANAERVRDALEQFPGQVDTPRAAQLAFTAHSIPISMAQTCDYAQQLHETCRLVAEASGIVPRALGSSTRAGAAGPTTPGSSRISSIISES